MGCVIGILQERPYRTSCLSGIAPSSRLARRDALCTYYLSFTLTLLTAAEDRFSGEDKISNARIRLESSSSVSRLTPSENDLTGPQNRCFFEKEPAYR